MERNGMSPADAPGYRWGGRKTTEFGPVGPDAVVIVPVGSVEQHGPHLPVEVDARLVTEIAARTAARVGAAVPILVLPTLWVSLAEHHMGFPGTLTLDLDAFRAVVRCLVGSVVRQGYRRVLLLNGHGGNAAALTVIVDDLARTVDAALACTTYWVAAAEAFGAILEGQPNLRHACEAETSMMLAIAPETVDMDRARSLEAPAEGLYDPGGIHRARPLETWSRSGVVGVPALAGAEKGERLLDAAAATLAAAIVEGSCWGP